MSNDPFVAKQTAFSVWLDDWPQNSEIVMYIHCSAVIKSNSSIRAGKVLCPCSVLPYTTTNCLPILSHALEVFTLDKRSTQSFDFAIDRYFIKLFEF